MAKKDMKKALGASLKAEEQAVRQRFDKKDKFARAESVLGGGGKLPGPAREGKHERVVRDSFTMPTADYGLISTIKQRCLKKGVSASKSEVVRAGLAALEAMSDRELVELVEKLPKVKTGRPAANGSKG